MERTREEILPGVWLTALRTDKFRTDTLSVTLLTQLSRENAAMNAVIPSVLRRGTARCPDMDALAAELDGLYGAAAVPVVRRLGEIQALGFLASFAAGDCVPGGEDLLSPACALTGDLLLSPVTRGGLLLPDYVQSEKQKLAERLRARVNDKGSYAMLRLIENMCSCEAYSAGAMGDAESAEAVHYQKLTRRYHELLASSPAEVFYCGGAPAARVRDAVRRALAVLPRGELDPDIGTDVRMNAVEAEPRIFTEALDVTQGKLSMGWRLGACMEDPNEAAIRVFNAVFGGSLTSKLFVNVREKLSLCYYASSAVDLQKGLLVAQSGIDFDKYDAVRDEILAQLEAVKRGEVSAAELDAARLSAASDLHALTDSPTGLESWWLVRNTAGDECTPEEMAALCEGVSADDVTAVARSTELDAIYFLRGTGEADGDGE